MVEQIIEI